MSGLVRPFGWDPPAALMRPPTGEPRREKLINKWCRNDKQWARVIMSYSARSIAFSEFGKNRWQWLSRYKIVLAFTVSWWNPFWLPTKHDHGVMKVQLPTLTTLTLSSASSFWNMSGLFFRVWHVPSTEQQQLHTLNNTPTTSSFWFTALNLDVSRHY